MKTGSIDDISIPGEQVRRPRKYATFALVLSLLLGIGILASLVALTKNASAQPATGAQTQDVPKGEGVPDSPDCGPGWVTVNSPNASTSDNALYGVAASSSNDVWAVGHYSNGSVDHTLIEHWDGSGWQIVFSPNQGIHDNHLASVAVVPNGDAWAVGYYLNSSGMKQTLIEHWNGTAWSAFPSPNANTNDNRLAAVAVVASGNAWAVGEYASGPTIVDPTRTLIEHWNGTAWSVVASPNASTNSNSLSGIAVVSDSNIWAVGDYVNSSADRTLTEHWNGTAWHVVDSPNANANYNYLEGVAAISAGDVWAVGAYQNGTALDTLTEHWNGTTWNVVYSPNPGVYADLPAVAAVSSTNLRAVGAYTGSAVGVDHSLVESGDGTSWSHVSSPDQGTNGNDLFGVVAISANDMWAVGLYGNTNLVARTFIIRYNPCSPTPTRTPTRTNTPRPFPTQCAINFADVPNPSTFYPYTQCLACRGIVGGYACGGANEPCDPNNDPYFRPRYDVSRGQIAKFVALAAQINTAVSGQTFEDVPPGSAFYTYTEQLHALGVMGGYACGGTNYPCIPPLNRPYFKPHNNATRGQIAKIDSKAAGFNDTPAGRQFQDVAVGSTFYTYTYQIATRSIMSGYTCGGTNEPCVPPANLPYFRPNNEVTRGQTAKCVANTFYPNCQAP